MTAPVVKTYQEHRWCYLEYAGSVKTVLLLLSLSQTQNYSCTVLDTEGETEKSDTISTSNLSMTVSVTKKLKYISVQ